MTNVKDMDEKYFFMRKFTGKLSMQLRNGDSFKQTASHLLQLKTYKKRIVNKWHVFVKLSMNKELIQFRHHNIRKKIDPENRSIFAQIQEKFCKKA